MSAEAIAASAIGALTPLYADPNRVGNFLGPGDGTNRKLARAALDALRDAGYSVVKLEQVGYLDRGVPGCAIGAVAPNQITEHMHPVFSVSEGSPLPEDSE